MARRLLPAETKCMRRRRRTVALLLAVAAIAPVHAAADRTAVPQAATDVRAALPAIEAYRADNGTYVGLTLAKIRAWDPSVRRITVKRATKNSYCIQSTRPGSVVHYNGPRGPVRTGRCGVRGNVVADPPPRPAPPGPIGDAGTAQRNLRAAIPAIEGYAADHDGYAGLTLEKIRSYDRGVNGITVVWAVRREYCLESTVGAETYYLNGPANSQAPGHCPAAPAPA
jgi:hypothetical protein